MRTYDEFHGRVPQKDIGKRLREIVKVEKKSFKIVTGYGSSSLRSQSKHAALSSLRRMVEEGIIVAYLPGEIKHEILKSNSSYFAYKIKYEARIKNDIDYGNDGIIFIFVAD